MPDRSIPLVRASALRRSFRAGTGPIAAVRSATFSISRGERIALVGSSGSGKSTLLGLIAGLDRADRGSIDWPGLSIRRGRPGMIAVAFQAPSLIPSLNVLENASLPLLLSGEPQASAEAEARAALDLFGVADLTAKLPEQISGGQAQRVVLARAVASRPELLLADEPTGQLDHATGLAAIEALLEWSNLGSCAIVIATHDAAVASRLETTWTIDHGVLLATVAEGSPRLGSAA